MRTLTIYGVDFEVIKPKKSNIATFDTLFTMSNCRTLHDCYTKPSQAKLNIWGWWRSWFAQVLCFLRVYHSNSFVVLVRLIVTSLHYTDCLHTMERITLFTLPPAHNRLIKVVE